MRRVLISAEKGGEDSKKEDGIVETRCRTRGTAMRLKCREQAPRSGTGYGVAALERNHHDPVGHRSDPIRQTGGLDSLSPAGLFDRIGMRSALIEADQAGTFLGANHYPGLPEDLFGCEGHDWQMVTVIPSRRLVGVRAGYTLSSTAWDHESFLLNILDAIE